MKRHRWLPWWQLLCCKSRWRKNTVRLLSLDYLKWGGVLSHHPIFHFSLGLLFGISRVLERVILKSGLSLQECGRPLQNLWFVHIFLWLLSFLFIDLRFVPPHTHLLILVLLSNLRLWLLVRKLILLLSRTVLLSSLFPPSFWLWDTHTGIK